MPDTNTKLTETDKAILESCKIIVNGLAEYLGCNYEIVLHSLENIDTSIIKIMNGFHTGRTEGGPITDFGLSMLSKIASEKGKNSESYFSKNKKGEPLKSSTIIIRGQGGKPIGLLCINFYLNAPIISLIQSNTPSAEFPYKTQIKENFSKTTDELILKSLDDIRLFVATDSSILPSLKNKRIVELLNDRGIFKIKDAVAIVARHLNISKNTVYLHLRGAKQ
ncbi:helix-turn-helix transcriptional regulator [Treponema socranskii]|nr:PAS domain-containing protein [Treponema socranskii]